MSSLEWARQWADVWDIAVPSRPGRLPGVQMAGFRERDRGGVDLHMVPHPAVTVAIDLADGTLGIDDAAGLQQRGSAVIGLAPARVRVRGRGIECLQVRLSPEVAHAVLGGATADVGGAVIALDELWGRDAERTQERLRAAESWDDRFRIVEDVLARRLRDHGSVDPEVASAWRRMLVSEGQARVETIAAEIGWSRKRLWSRFRAQVGLTPKQAAQLVRFDRAAHRLARGRGAAIVAAEGGYADQSHLHRDAVAFAGLPPSAVAVAPWLAVDDLAWAG